MTGEDVCPTVVDDKAVLAKVSVCVCMVRSIIGSIRCVSYSSGRQGAAVQGQCLCVYCKEDSRTHKMCPMK